MRLKGFKPELTQILISVARRVDHVFKVMDSKVKVTDNIFQKCTLSRRHTDRRPSTVASPGFVARRGKAGDYVMGHSRRASGPGAADCSITNSFVSNAVLVERAVSC